MTDIFLDIFYNYLLLYHTLFIGVFPETYFQTNIWLRTFFLFLVGVVIPKWELPKHIISKGYLSEIKSSSIAFLDKCFSSDTEHLQGAYIKIESLGIYGVILPCRDSLADRDRWRITSSSPTPPYYGTGITFYHSFTFTARFCNQPKEEARQDVLTRRI